MFKKYRKSFVFMLVFLLVASFSAPLLFPTQALVEEARLPTHTCLTGTISDAGIDTDGSGKFDYLKISVEVNVSVAGDYIVTINGLRAEGWMDACISVSDTKREYLTPGTHMVDIYLYGPMIHQYGLNPTKVSWISLQSVRYELFMPIIEFVDSGGALPLSRQYNYTEFDAHFSDVEAMFTVYPNGSVALSGALNYAHMVPFNPSPEVYGTAEITKNGELTVVAANSTFVVPQDVVSRLPVELPFNTTEVSYQEQYSDTQFSSDLSVNMTLPPWLASEYPFNTTDLSLLGTYSEGIGSMGMNCTTVVPDSIRSMFPLNVTDVTITGQYMNESLTGNITFHVVSGFPIFDFGLGFEGNKTYLSLTGEGLVIYGDYPAIGFSIDQITLEAILMQYDSTIPGMGPGSLYEMTNEILECTNLNTTLTPYDNIGAWVDFDVGIHGNFIEMITYVIMMQFFPPYYYMPLETREQVHDIIYTALNTTVNSVESVNFQIVYMHDTGEVEIRMTFVEDVLYLVGGLAEIAKNATAILQPMEQPAFPSYMVSPLYPIIYAVISLNATLPYISEAQTQLTYSCTTGRLQLRATSSGEIDLEEYYYPTYPLPEEMPPELRELFESLQKTRLCNVTSYNQSFTYRNSTGNLRMEYTLEGDLNAQVNLVKSYIVSYMNLTSPAQITWRELFLNQTLIDLVQLQINFEVRSTSAIGELTRIMLSPPIDPVNATCFRLERLFNLTSVDYGNESPIAGQRLKIAVKGGNNGTHTVTLFIDPTDPERVPDPDEFAEGNTMIWNNQSISKLKRLIFKVWEGYVETVYNPASITQDNPFMIDAKETASCVLTLTNISKLATLCIKNITAPADVSPPPGTYKVLGNYIQITADPEDVTVNGTIRIYYTPEQLSELELDENSLKIFYWNETTNNWEAIDTQINTTEHYVWATISHLSIWSLMGQPLPALWEQPWFLISITVIVVIVIVVVVLGLRRKKQSL
ncbi:MAG: hypothetical protein QMD13_06755 [Candidatus Bathyarchaeia archaeon]|nr:hypothetical protein [Candidatus Bathyarchaeia archaeon]